MCVCARCVNVYVSVCACVHRQKSTHVINCHWDQLNGKWHESHQLETERERERNFLGPLRVSIQLLLRINECPFLLSWLMSAVNHDSHDERRERKYFKVPLLRQDKNCLFSANKSHFRALPVDFFVSKCHRWTFVPQVTQCFVCGASILVYICECKCMSRVPHPRLFGSLARERERERERRKREREREKELNLMA